MPFEVLHCAFVFLGGGEGFEGTKISAFSRLRILFPRIEPEAARGEFSNHRDDFFCGMFLGAPG